MATAKLKRKPRLSKIESYKAAADDIKEVQFRLKFCVVAHRYIPGCCCSSLWADMSTVLGAWVLVNAKALGPHFGIRIRIRETQARGGHRRGGSPTAD